MNIPFQEEIFLLAVIHYLKSLCLFFLVDTWSKMHPEIFYTWSSWFRASFKSVNSTKCQRFHCVLIKNIFIILLYTVRCWTSKSLWYVICTWLAYEWYQILIYTVVKSHHYKRGLMVGIMIYVCNRNISNGP